MRLRINTLFATLFCAFVFTSVAAQLSIAEIKVKEQKMGSCCENTKAPTARAKVEESKAGSCCESKKVTSDKVEEKKSGSCCPTDKSSKERHRRYIRSLETYKIPNAVLTNQDGEKVILSSIIESSKPLALNFIFTTCSTICPVQTATFANLQKELGPEAGGLEYVSITIDPEYDTPSNLKKYSEKYNAGPEWQFLTGDVNLINTIQKAFNAYAGNKMNHRPLTFIKNNGSDKWVRIEGLASTSDLAKEYLKMMGKS